MRYRFTEMWANVVAAAGWVVFLGSVGAGLAHGLARETGLVTVHPLTRFNTRVEELFIVLACAVAGFVAGGTLIVLGQMLHALLDIRRIAFGVHHDLRRAPPRQPFDREED